MPDPGRGLRGPALLAAVALAIGTPGVQAQAARNVVLVTLDGVRVQELFGGYDTVVAGADRAKSGIESPDRLRAEYWRPTREERRRALMPFFWDSLVPRGVLFGDESLGTRATVSNPHRFSAPGYLEILTGRYQPDVTSNDPIRYSHRTILELTREGLRLPREAVALFGSWENFRWYGAADSSAIVINAGFDTLPGHLATPLSRAVGRMQDRVPAMWEGSRLDAFTGELGLEYLRTRHPRFLYLAFNDTDDLSHLGRYDLLLGALREADAFLRQLWQALQADPRYRGTTTLLVTTDHGRGRTPDDWGDHGREVLGAEQIWVLAVGPGVQAQGEARDRPPVIQAQIAGTILGLLGVPAAVLGQEVAPPLPLGRP